MMDEIKQEADARMAKTIEAMVSAFGRIRTGRASPSLLDGIDVSYYGNDTPLSQVASITVEDARTLMIAPWEKNLLPDIEKAVLKSDLGITPSSNGDCIRIPLPPLTEENRKDLAKHARSEAENSKISVRNIRRDAIGQIRDLMKEKEIAEDEARRGEESVQKLTDAWVKQIDDALQTKEADLLEI